MSDAPLIKTTRPMCFNTQVTCELRPLFKTLMDDFARDLSVLTGKQITWSENPEGTDPKFGDWGAFVVDDAVKCVHGAETDRGYDPWVVALTKDQLFKTEVDYLEPIPTRTKAFIRTAIRFVRALGWAWKAASIGANLPKRRVTVKFYGHDTDMVTYIP